MVCAVLKVQVKHFMEKDQKALFRFVILPIEDIYDIGAPVFNMDIRQRHCRKDGKIEHYQEAAELFPDCPGVNNDSAWRRHSPKKIAGHQGKEANSMHLLLNLALHYMTYLIVRQVKCQLANCN